MSYVPYPSAAASAHAATTATSDFNEVIGRKFEFNRFFDNTPTQKKESSSCNKQKKPPSPPPPSSPSTPSSQQTLHHSSFQAKPYQRMLCTYMSPWTPYFGVLLFHGTGTGKTCTSIGIAERFASVYAKPPLVIFPSGLLRDNYEVQTKDCGTPGLVAKWEFRGAVEFANMYKRMEESSPTRQAFEEALRQVFSDRVIIVDEAHNLRSEETMQKQVPPKLIHVLRVAQNTRLVLLTATPMFDTAREVVFMLNLLLANDKRQEIMESDVFRADDSLLPDKRGENALRAASRGYVSFQGVKNAKLFPERMPVPKSIALKKSGVPTHDIYGTPLSPSERFPSASVGDIACSTLRGAQLLAYTRIACTIAAKGGSELDRASCDADTFVACERGRAGKTCASLPSASKKRTPPRSPDSKGAAVTTTTTTNALAQLTMVSNIVFPSPGIDLQKNDPSTALLKYVTGEIGFNRCFEQRQSDGKYAYRHGVRPFLDADNLADHACKLDTIVRSIEESDGIVLVHSRLVVSGLLPLAFALEHRGFRRYGGRSLLHHRSGRGGAAGASGKKPSYVLWTGDGKLSPDNAGEIAVAKSPENAHGARIKVILASDVAKEGIDLKCIRHVHIMDPWFNLNKLRQIVGRAIRQCSHAALPPHKRNVTVYPHTAVLPQTGSARANDTPREESADMRTYRIAYAKQVKIDLVAAILEDNAIDTAVERWASTSKSDRSTFRPEYAQPDIEACANQIRACFKDEVALTYADLRGRAAPGVDEEIFVWALQAVLDDPSPTAVFSKAAATWGRIVYLSDKYMFQPQSNPDPRLPLADRGEAAAAASATASGNLMHRIAMRLRPDTTEGTTSSPKSSRAAVKASVDDVERDVAALLARVGCDPVTYRNAAIDYVLDRMSCEEQLLIFPLTKPATLARRMAALPHVFGDVPDNAGDPHQPVPDHFINFEANKSVERYLKWRPAKRTFEYSPLDERLMRARERMAARAVFHADRLAAIVAFVPADPKRRTFKNVVSQRHLQGGALNGTGCVMTSTIKKQYLVEEMMKLDKTLGKVFGGVVGSKDSMKKDVYCEMYELALRKHAPHRFMRPFEHHLVAAARKTT